MHSPIMPDELDIVTRVARFDAIHANRVPIGRVAGMTPVKVVHRKGRVRADLVQTLATRNRLLHLVLVVEDLVAPGNRLDATGQTQSAEFVVEDLVELQRCCSIVGNLNARCQSVEYPVTLQNRMTLGRYQYSGLSISENVVLLQDSLTSVEYADTTVTSIIDFIPLQRWIRISLDPHTGHSIVENLVLLQQPQTPIINQHASILASPNLIPSDHRVTTRSDLHS